MALIATASKGTCALSFIGLRWTMVCLNIRCLSLSYGVFLCEQNNALKSYNNLLIEPAFCVSLHHRYSLRTDRIHVDQLSVSVLLFHLIVGRY